MSGRAAGSFDLMMTLREVPVGGLRLDVWLGQKNCGKPQAVRGVNLAQLGIANLTLDQPRRLGLTLPRG